MILFEYLIIAASALLIVISLGYIKKLCLRYLKKMK